VTRRLPIIASAICLLAISPCTSATLQSSDHFDGHRFHNRDRASAPEPTFWEESRVAELAIARKVHGVEETQFVAPRLGQVFQY
jgi:hypothetical protein